MRSWSIQIGRWWRAWRRPPSLGQLGERAAEKYLKRKGYKIVARGVRRQGSELDLVAVDGRTIVFVEVKTRRGDVAGAPAEAIDEMKQRRMTTAALAFLKRHALLGYSARFDAVAVTWPADARRPTIEHIPNAFEAVGGTSIY